MKKLDEIMNEVLFDIDLNDNIEDCKMKMENIIHQMNGILKNTDFKIVNGEMNSEKDDDVVFLNVMIKLPKD